MIRIGGFSQGLMPLKKMAPDRGVGGTAGRPCLPVRMTEDMIAGAGWKTNPRFDREIKSWGDQQKFLRDCPDEFNLYDAQEQAKPYVTGLIIRVLRERDGTLREDANAMTTAVAGMMAEDLCQPYAYHCRAVSVFTGLGNGIGDFNGLQLDMPTLKALALCDLRMNIHTDKAATLLFALDEDTAAPIIHSMQDHSPVRFHELIEEMVTLSGGRPE